MSHKSIIYVTLYFFSLRFWVGIFGYFLKKIKTGYSTAATPRAHGKRSKTNSFSRLQNSFKKYQVISTDVMAPGPGEWFRTYAYSHSYDLTLPPGVISSVKVTQLINAKLFNYGMFKRRESGGKKQPLGNARSLQDLTGANIPTFGDSQRKLLTSLSNYHNPIFKTE